MNEGTSAGDDVQCRKQRWREYKFFVKDLPWRADIVKKLISWFGQTIWGNKISSSKASYQESSTKCMCLSACDKFQ